MSIFSGLSQMLAKTALKGAPKAIGKTILTKEGPTALSKIKTGLINAYVPLNNSMADRFGKVGQTFDDLFIDAIDTATTKNGLYANGIRHTLKNLTAEQDILINRAMNGEAVTLTSDLRKRKDYRRFIDNKFWENEVDVSGIPAERGTAFRQNHFPREYPHEVLESYRNAGPAREAVISKIMLDKEMGRNDAISILDSQLGQRARMKLHGPIDFKRLTDLPGYKLDSGSLFNSYEKGLKRVELAKRFGINGERINEMAKSLPEEQRQLFIELGNQIVGPALKRTAIGEADNTVLSWLRNDMVKRYMTYSAINNMWQGPLASFVTTDLASSLKAFSSIVRGADKPFLDTVGAIQAELTISFNQFVGNNEYFGKSGFLFSERFVRSFQGLSGKFYSTKIYKRLLSGDPWARNEFKQLGLDPDRLIANGLTGYDKLKIANKLIHRTQFRFDAGALPLWHQDPLYKTLFAMQSYNIQWMNFIRKYVLKDVAHNPLPLIKLLGMGYVVGGVNRVMWDTILGKRADKDHYTNIIKNIGYSGSLGLLGDMMEGGVVGKALSSPAINILNEGIRAIAQAAKGNFNPALGTLANRGLFPAMVEHLPAPIGLPAAVLGRHYISKALRKNNDKNTK